MRDVTINETSLAEVVQKLHVPVAYCDNEGNVIERNTAWGNLRARKRNLLEMMGKVESCVGRLKQLLAGELDTIFDEVKLGCRWYKLELFRINPERVGVVLTDISDLKVQILEVTRNSETDILTGLPNRRYFFNAIEPVLPVLHKRRKVATLFMVDLNKFKWINDTYGHEVGDKVLVLTAKRLRRALRPKDTLGRWGGDEFVVFLPDLEPDQAAAVMERCTESLIQPFQINSLTLNVSASIGYACAPRDGAQLKSVLECADRAMYRQKSARHFTTEVPALYGERRVSFEKSN